MRIRHILSFLVWSFFIGPLWAQEEAVTFISPFDFPLKLSASFGELREGHLHGGLDIKTEGVVGKPIHSIADGYISRATVSYGGFGQAVYVTHPNGFTSVYGHILRFSPEVSKRIDAYQYDHETFLADLRFDPDQLPVKAGDIIAWSGNEGFSFGPHLHMELHRTDTGQRVDPLPYFLKKIDDKTPPRATGIVVYPQRGEGIVNDSPRQVFIALKDLNLPIKAWGKIAFGLSANDYMDGTTNNYGVRLITLSVDTTEIFRSTVDAFGPDDNPMINAWTDYAEKTLRNRWIMRSHILPGNRLSLLTAKKRGVVDINEERDYHFTYLLQDCHGNRTTYRFTVKGVKREIPFNRSEETHFLYHHKTNLIQEPGMELVIPRGTLYEDEAVKCKVLMDSSAVSYTYQLSEQPVALSKGCELTIGIRHLPVPDTTKYYIARKYKGKTASVGGTYKHGWITARIHELGTYIVAIDTVGPKVIPKDQKGWGTGKIRFHVGDAGTGLKSYRVEIDGRFEIFGYNAKSAVLSMKHPERLKRGVHHELTITATDFSGNVTEQTYRF